MVGEEAIKGRCVYVTSCQTEKCVWSVTGWPHHQSLTVTYNDIYNVQYKNMQYTMILCGMLPDDQSPGYNAACTVNHIRPCSVNIVHTARLLAP